MKSILTTLLYCITGWLVFLFQVQAQGITSFLSYNPSAVVSGLGGQNVSLANNADPTFAKNNPGLLNDTMCGKLSCSAVNYLADMGMGNVSTAFRLRKVGYMHLSGQYLSYGHLTQTDEYGNVLGSFTANNTIFTVGVGRAYGNIHFGMNAKFFNASLYNNVAGGMAIDFGGSCQLAHGFSVGLALQNIGGVLYSNYSSGNAGNPFQLVMGVSEKLAHAPLRFSLTGTRLQTIGAAFSSNANADDNQTSGINVFLEHFIASTELLLSPAFQLRASYNHQIHQEFKVGQSFSLNGFSLGCGLHIKRIYFDYAYSPYFNSVNAHTFSILVDLKRKPKSSSLPPDSKNWLQVRR